MSNSSAISKIENKSGMVPLQYKVLIEVDKVSDKIGSFYMPDATKDKQAFEMTRGTVIAVGPAAFSDGNQFPEGTPVPEIGDHIYFDKHAGAQIKSRVGEVYYRVLEDTDIVGTSTMSTTEAQAEGLAA